MSYPCAKIDGQALRNNLSVVRRLAPRSRVLAAIKANAYGHGLIPSARALAQADAFGLARIEEALTLRDAGIEHPLVLLEGVMNTDHLALAAAHRLELVVHSFEQVAMLEGFGPGRRFSAWLKLDTGMHRLGFAPAEFIDVHQRLSRCPSVASVRVMTHLAAADEPERLMTQQQLDTFDSVTRGLNAERSIANSAGLIAFPEARVEWVRPGIMLYGISPLPLRDAVEIGLQPAMTLSTQLIARQSVRVGETVGYGGVWRAERDSTIGIAAIGYGDGYPRTSPSGTPVLINGREAPIAGRISMDMLAIDVTDLADAKSGDEVILWGRGLPAERIAHCAHTIGYELVCRVNARVQRRWVRD